jgi:hypothetical protein
MPVVVLNAIETLGIGIVHSPSLENKFEVFRREEVENGVVVIRNAIQCKSIPSLH